MYWTPPDIDLSKGRSHHKFCLSDKIQPLGPGLLVTDRPLLFSMELHGKLRSPDHIAHSGCFSYGFRLKQTVFSFQFLSC